MLKIDELNEFLGKKVKVIFNSDCNLPRVTGILQRGNIYNSKADAWIGKGYHIGFTYFTRGQIKAIEDWENSKVPEWIVRNLERFGNCYIADREDYNLSQLETVYNMKYTLDPIGYNEGNLSGWIIHKL